MSPRPPGVVSTPAPHPLLRRDLAVAGRSARPSRSRGTALRTGSADPVLHVLVALTAVVLALDTAAQLVPGLAAVRGWVDVSLENNVPTAWSVVLLLTLSVRLWTRRERGRLWYAAALTALVLAVDEWVGWHEHLRVPGELLRSVGIALPTYAWVLPGAALAAAAVIAAVPWLRSLPRRDRRRFALALGVFCTGALGVEAVTGVVVHMGGSPQLWAHLTSVEEALEMAGVVVAVSALDPRESSR